MLWIHSGPSDIVLLRCDVMWFCVTQAKRNISSVSCLSRIPLGLFVVCMYLCAFWVQVLALAACFLAAFFCLPSTCTPVIHEYETLTAKKWNKKSATQVGCLAKALEGRVCGNNRGTSFVLLWCAQFQQRKRRARKESLERRWERREEKDEKEADQVKRGKQMCVCIYMWGAQIWEWKMGALRALSTPFSSSHSWEIWSTKLGGTNTQTQINCRLENKSSFPLISLQFSISPCRSSKRCCVNGDRFQTLTKNSSRGEKKGN